MNFIEGIILHVATDPAYEGQRTLIAVQTIIREALIPAAPEDPRLRVPA